MKKQFVALGLQRSGTNFTEQLVRNNVQDLYVCNIWRTGVWKHAYDIENKPEPPTNVRHMDYGIYGGQQKYSLIEKGSIKALYIHKHPYSWLESITDNPVDIGTTYPFLTSKVVPKTDDNADMFFGEFYLPALAKMYADHTTYWYNVHEKAKWVLTYKYEDLIKSEEESRRILKQICTKFKFDLKKEDHIIVPTKVGQSDEFTEEKRERYSGIKIRKFSYRHIRTINSHMNHETLKKQGYSLITNDDEYMNHKIKIV